MGARRRGERGYGRRGASPARGLANRGRDRGPCRRPHDPLPDHWYREQWRLRRGSNHRRTSGSAGADGAANAHCARRLSAGGDDGDDGLGDETPRRDRADESPRRGRGTDRAHLPERSGADRAGGRRGGLHARPGAGAGIGALALLGRRADVCGRPAKPRRALRWRRWGWTSVCIICPCSFPAASSSACASPAR